MSDELKGASVPAQSKKSISYVLITDHSSRLTRTVL